MAITTEEKLEIAKVIIDAQIDALGDMVGNNMEVAKAHASRTREYIEEWLSHNPDYRPVFEAFGADMKDRAAQAVAEARAELVGENGRSA